MEITYRDEYGNEFTESEVEDRYCELLDELHGDFMDSYPASRALKAVDPIAYRVGLNDYTSDLEEVQS